MHSLDFREDRFQPRPGVVARLPVGFVSGQGLLIIIGRLFVGCFIALGYWGRRLRIVWFTRAHEPMALARVSHRIIRLLEFLHRIPSRRHSSVDAHVVLRIESTNWSANLFQ